MTDKKRVVFHNFLKHCMFAVLVVSLIIPQAWAFAENGGSTCLQAEGTRTVVITPGSVDADSLDVAAYMPYKDNRMQETSQTYSDLDASPISKKRM